MRASSSPQDSRRIEVFSRGEGVSWLMTPHGEGERVPIPALGIELDVEAVYVNPLAR